MERTLVEEEKALRDSCRAIRHGIDSAEWNRYLSGLNHRERRSTVKRIRAMAIYSKHASYWPKPSSYPRYKGQTGSVAE